MKRPANRRLGTWILVVAVASFGVYKLKFAPIPAIGHTVARGEIVAEAMGTGTLEARVKTTISARIQERLLEVLVDQGDSVKSGQMLARLDDGESRQQVAIAEAAAQVGVAEKTLLFREALLAFTEIHSPYDGLVIRRDRDPGDILVPGASLMQLISLEELWVSAWGGPFAEVSRIPANLEDRVRSVPGVAGGRRFISHAIQREHNGRPLRLVVQGLSWPEDRGDRVPLIAGRPLGQAHL